jgi:heme/copper-type cytochrome/quinol oxidase subunit 2
MRERMLAVGCGGLLLLMALLTAAVTLVGVWQGDQSALIGWVVTASTGVVALAAFAVGIRRKVDDEDPLDGERGLAVALTIVVVIAVTGLAIAFYLQPDFWRGIIDGRGS